MSKKKKVNYFPERIRTIEQDGVKKNFYESSFEVGDNISCISYSGNSYKTPQEIQSLKDAYPFEICFSSLDIKDLLDGLLNKERAIQIGLTFNEIDEIKNTYPDLKRADNVEIICKLLEEKGFITYVDGWYDTHTLTLRDLLDMMKKNIEESNEIFIRFQKNNQVYSVFSTYIDRETTDNRFFNNWTDDSYGKFLLGKRYVNSFFHNWYYITDDTKKGRFVYAMEKDRKISPKKRLLDAQTNMIGLVMYDKNGKGKLGGCGRIYANPIYHDFDYQNPNTYEIRVCDIDNPAEKSLYWISTRTNLDDTVFIVNTDGPEYSGDIVLTRKLEALKNDLIAKEERREKKQKSE